MEIQAAHFNFWTSVLAGVAGLGFILTILIATGVSNFSTGRGWLALVVGSFSVVLSSFTLFWTGLDQFFPYLSNIWPAVTMLTGPALYFYLKSAFKEPAGSRAIVLHFLVPALSFLFILPATLLSDQSGIYVTDLLKIGSSPILLLSQLVYYSLQINHVRYNDWQIDSNIQTWTRIVAGGMWVFTGAFLSYYLLVRCSFFNPNWDYGISTVMALSILGITYMGLIQRRVFRSEPIDRFLPVKKYQSSTLTPGAGDSILKRMKHLMEVEQIFKENELRLDDLAAYLNTGRHQISQVINEHYGVNFFELINRYRVAHVQKLLADPSNSHYTIMQLAYESGFNNKASFNRYFKNATGMTPSAYRLYGQHQVN